MTATTVELPRILARVPLRQLARVTRRTPRTISNWLSGVTAPNAHDLITVMAQFDDITNEVLRLVGRRALTDSQLDKLKKALSEI